MTLSQRSGIYFVSLALGMSDNSVLCFGRLVAMSDSRVPTPLSCLPGTAEQFEANRAKATSSLLKGKMLLNWSPD
jgi:hypothetical protein